MSHSRQDTGDTVMSHCIDFYSYSGVSNLAIGTAEVGNIRLKGTTLKFLFWPAMWGSNAVDIELNTSIVSLIRLSLGFMNSVIRAAEM